MFDFMHFVAFTHVRTVCVLLGISNRSFTRLLHGTADLTLETIGVQVLFTAAPATTDRWRCSPDTDGSAVSEQKFVLAPCCFTQAQTALFVQFRGLHLPER